MPTHSFKIQPQYSLHFPSSHVYETIALFLKLLLQPNSNLKNFNKQINVREINFMIGTKSSERFACFSRVLAGSMLVWMCDNPHK